MAESMFSVNQKDKEGTSFGFLEPGVCLCAVFNQTKLQEGTSLIFKSYFQVKKQLPNP